MASPSLLTTDRNEPAHLDSETCCVVAGLRNPVSRDYIAHGPGLVLFLNRRLSDGDNRRLDEIIDRAGKQRVDFVCVVSSFRVDLGDCKAAATERYVLNRLNSLGARTVVFRAGHVLSTHSRLRIWLRRLGWCYPLVPESLRSCVVDGDELFAAIEAERNNTSSQETRVLTLLGPNRSWRSLLAEHRSDDWWSRFLTAACRLLAFLMIGQMAALLLKLSTRFLPQLKHWHVDTLEPGSFRELLALYNKHNYRHVKVVGYNNGIVHFGHRYPGKTIVSTVRCNRVAWAGDGTIVADSGATLRKIRDHLAAKSYDLYVIPNYSYVCIGTAFFVPIHGSASDYAALAETMDKVILFDPVAERLISATRDEPEFREHVYNLKSNLLLLRVYVRVKPRVPYYLDRQELTNPDGQTLLDALRDKSAANVEIRKSKGSSDVVQLCRYYNDAGTTQSPVLEIPRDSIGRLWDRLEENPITSYLMHALTRKLAWHVELFFTDEEFLTFWRTHRTLPLKKIQLRYLRRDGFPHSPFRDHDCVSSDMFLFRRHRAELEAYLRQNFSVVRSNPGKHSE